MQMCVPLLYNSSSGTKFNFRREEQRASTVQDAVNVGLKKKISKRSKIWPVVSLNSSEFHYIYVA